MRKTFFYALLIVFLLSTSIVMAGGGEGEEYPLETNQELPVEPCPECSIDESLYLLLASGLLFSFVYLRKLEKDVK